jgi:hypothetical protein
MTASTTSIKLFDYNATTNIPFLEFLNYNLNSSMPSFELLDYNITFANGSNKCKNCHGTQKRRNFKFIRFNQLHQINSNSLK